ncbi:unnamed protein product [Dibothriocephalus latus]|uniref:Carboxylesterase type B domain-containing protein n=1 Tax=Dibothriocephalus latus TaxID=60516 RepID=A0A3P6PBT3_DIBLA|nr:unnamed protein product [Dibothriocephalus latus]
MPGTDVYNYVFVHKTVNNSFPNWTGAMHGYEIKYLFGMSFSEKWLNEFSNYTYNETKTSLFVMKIWANFARVGDPSRHEFIPPMSSTWPKYEVNSRKYMEIGLDFKVKQHRRKEFCKFWNDELSTFVRDKVAQEGRPANACLSIEPYFNQHRKLFKFINATKDNDTETD